MAREKALEAGRAQLELEWRERASEAERKATSRAQQVVRQLAQGKEEVSGRGERKDDGRFPRPSPSFQACAELQLARDELSQQQAVVVGVARERDVAIATLNSNNLRQQFLRDLQQCQ